MRSAAILGAALLLSTVHAEEEWYSREDFDALAEGDTSNTTTSAPATPAPRTSAPDTNAPSNGGVPTLTQWCTTDSTCSENGDPEGICNTNVFQCICSNGFGPQMYKGLAYFWGCYEELREVVTFLRFSAGVCVNNLVPTSAASWVYRMFNRIYSVYPRGLSATCGSIDVVAVADVGVTAALGLTQESVQAAVAAELAVDGDSALGTAVAATVEVGSSVLPTQSVLDGSTPYPATESPPTTTSACTMNNTASAFYVQGTTVCNAVQCDVPYVKWSATADDGTTYFYCGEYNAANFTCLVDEDCTFDAEKFECVNTTGECIIGTSPLNKTTTITQAPTSFAANWCTTDSDCRLGILDPAATCTDNSTAEITLGRFCTCQTTGYDYPTSDPDVLLCVPTGTTEIPVSFGAYYSTGNLTDFTSTISSAFGTALEGILGGSIDGGVNSVGGTGVAIFGVISANVVKIGNMVRGTLDLKIALAAAFTAAREASTLSSTLGELTSASASNGVQCTSAYATRTTLVGTVCHAVTCQSDAYRFNSNDVYSCALTPSSRSTDDDDLGTYDKTVLGLGIAFGVIVVIVGVVLIVSCKKNNNDVPETGKHEPIEAA